MTSCFFYSFPKRSRKIKSFLNGRVKAKGPPIKEKKLFKIGCHLKIKLFISKYGHITLKLAIKHEGGGGIMAIKKITFCGFPKAPNNMYIGWVVIVKSFYFSSLTFITRFSSWFKTKA